MKQITEGTNFVFHTLLSLRKQLRLEEVPAEFSGIASYLESLHCRMTGPYITHIHSGEMESGADGYDVEILVPLPVATEVAPPYTFVPCLLIRNCVNLRYHGPADDIEEQYDALMRYTREHRLEPVTGLYQIHETGSGLDFFGENLSVNLCIGTKKA
jgi:hypothetical protein